MANVQWHLKRANPDRGGAHDEFGIGGLCDEHVDSDASKTTAEITAGLLGDPHTHPHEWVRVEGHPAECAECFSLKRVNAGMN